MVISQLVPFARSAGLTPRTAAFAISVGAAGSASGRFFSGWMSDHFGRLFTLRSVIVLSMLATPMLYLERAHVRSSSRCSSSCTTATARSSLVYTALAGDFTAKYLRHQLWILLLAWGFAGVSGTGDRLARIRQHRELPPRVLRRGVARLRGARQPGHRPRAKVLANASATPA
jgi:MFS family permease